MNLSSFSFFNAFKRMMVVDRRIIAQINRIDEHRISDQRTKIYEDIKRYKKIIIIN